MPTTAATLSNHQVRLARRPSGAPVAQDWSFTSEAVAQPAEGGVLVRTLTSRRSASAR
jgi:NADPH-dependent curcumin reductase CurA